MTTKADLDAERVSKIQSLIDVGLNAFAVELLCESFAAWPHRDMGFKISFPITKGDEPVRLLLSIEVQP